MADATKKKVFPDVKEHAGKCVDFFQTFVTEEGAPKYLDMLQDVANKKRVLFEVHLDDVRKHTNDEEFVQAIERNTQRYQDLFARAADSLMPEPSAEAVESLDVVDIYNEQRLQRVAMARAGRDEADGSQPNFPPELLRRFHLVILPRSSAKTRLMRDVKSKDIGAIVKVSGVITRVTDVQPSIKVVAYICTSCGAETYQTVTDRVFTPLVQCTAPRCTKNENKGKLFMQIRGSRFFRYQELKLQEQPSEVPVGHIPRSTTLRCYGPLTRRCTPGEVVTVSGMYLPAVYRGYRQVRAGLMTETYIEVTAIESTKQKFSAMTLDESLAEQVAEKAEEKDVYDQLSSSIAPEIFGHEDVKKALLLLLVGGGTRTLADGMKIRGDLNILLMGDPGVAKSQLLKHIAHIAPRAVYTTGKGSSGVGLTAAVTRDAVTGEMTLEGGALVLADMGICCIDEFDKMEEGDRTAIHEVMEQQTVSIAKAGITTTLNARTSIVAAANPVYGRWNPELKMEQNIGLPTALLSRFDLQWILLDKPNEETDRELAMHVTHVHRVKAPPKLDFTPLSPAFLRAYISKARAHTPVVPTHLTEEIVGHYLTMRKEGDVEYGAGARRRTKYENTRQLFCTARSLLAILRVGQALARLHFRDEVTKDDVDEAVRLLTEAKRSALPETDERKQRGRDPVGEIFTLIKLYRQQKGLASVRVADIRPKVFTKGHTEADLNRCIQEYEDAGIWVADDDGGVIRFLTGASSSSSQL